MQTYGANKQGSVFVYVILCLLVAGSSSLLAPVLSLFLSTKLHFSSLQISAFFVILPIATIFLVQLVARFSDRGLQRPTIIVASGVFGVITCYLLYTRPSFLVMSTVGVLVMGLYPMAFPQVFASAHEFSLKRFKDSLMFTTFLRSLTSLSWAFGPPIAYAIAIGYNFDTLFMVNASVFIICSLITFFFLPHIPKDDNNAKQATNANANANAEPPAKAIAANSQNSSDDLANTNEASNAIHAGADNGSNSAKVAEAANGSTKVAKAEDSDEEKWWTNRSVILLFAGFSLMFTAFSGYIVTMPLFITEELGLDKHFPGYALGIAAALEIPIMFVAAKISKRIGIKPVIILGAVSMVIFLFLMYFVKSPHQFLILQIFPALNIGLVGTLGMLYFQKLLPKIPGQATSLFTNTFTAGQVAGGALISLAALGSYTYIFITGFFIAIVATFLLLLAKKP